MLRRARPLHARLAAAFLAVALSGALQAPALAAPPRPHKCECRAGSHGADHECECARCRDEARAARARDLDKLPPCHRAAAQKAAAAQEPRTPAGPCLRGSCGAPEVPQSLVLPTAERVVMPATPAPAAPPVARLAATVARAPAHDVPAPPTPPPRA
jgi:hypothetical protein